MVVQNAIGNAKLMRQILLRAEADRVST